MENNSKIILYTDGGSRGNPGPAGIGVVLSAVNGAAELVHIGDIKKHIGSQTNNFAEYTALITGLEEARKLGYKKASCFLDSELVVKQLNGLYKVKEETLKPLHAKVKEISCGFDSVTFAHVPREKNSAADKLVNEALDEAI